MSSPSNKKAYSIENARKIHANAYENWFNQEDAILSNMHSEGKSIDELSILFQRSPGAIQSRINKLASSIEIDYSGFKRANHLLVNLSFDWIPVLQTDDALYYFPNPITPFMTQLYKSPAIYRWNIYENTPSDKKLIYIGEGQQLIPGRIKGYLNPGPSQKTNLRLNAVFTEQIANGFNVLFEIIRFDNLILGNSSFAYYDLKDKHFRRFLEHLLITHYQQKGFSLLNR